MASPSLAEAITAKSPISLRATRKRHSYSDGPIYIFLSLPAIDKMASPFLSVVQHRLDARVVSLGEDRRSSISLHPPDASNGIFLVTEASGACAGAYRRCDSPPLL